jgi:hypothetical protein
VSRWHQGDVAMVESNSSYSRLCQSRDLVSHATRTDGSLMDTGLAELGQRLAGAGLLTAALALNGCGAATENSSTVTTSGTVIETTGTSPSPSASSPGPSGSGSGSGSAGSPDTGLAWVPFGPDDPKFPTPGWDVYYYFLAHDCGSLQSSVQTPGDGFGNLYKAAVAVCRAAVDGEQSQWSVASEAFADRGDGVLIGPASCVDDTIASMVSTLLDWHQTHPGRQPDLTFPRTADGRTACSRDNNEIAGPDDDSSESSTTSPTESTESSTTTTSTTSSTPATAITTTTAAG